MLYNLKGRRLRVEDPELNERTTNKKEVKENKIARANKDRTRIKIQTDE
jgi:hypothetical protein